MPRYHEWTSPSQKPFTAGNEAIHQEIASEQVFHWTPQMIAKAEREGYFEGLSKRAQAKRYGSLLEDEEELL